MAECLDNIWHALNAATSQEPGTVKRAEHTLIQLRSCPGFYRAVAQLAADRSVALNVRWMAVLYLKNSMEGSMRCSMPAEERAAVHAHLLTCYSDPSPHLAVQVAALMGRMARQDCPAQWPELVPTLLEGVAAASSALQLQRCLQALDQVVQAMASRRLTASRRLFQQLATAATPVVLSAWHHLSIALADNKQSPEDRPLSLHSVRLCVKLLRRILAHGPRRPSEADCAVSTIVQLVFPRCHDALLYRQHLCQQGASQSQLIELMEKYIGCQVKLLLDVLDRHPLSFVAFITRSLEFGTQLLFTEQGQCLLFDRLAQLWLTLIHRVLTCDKFRPPNDVQSPCEQLTKQANSVIGEFFDDQCVHHMLRQMVGRYMVMREPELRSWQEEPEAFFLADDALSISAATESLLTALMKRFRCSVTSLLVAMLREQMVREGSDVLARDAVYRAIGLAAYDLYDEVDMDGWLGGGGLLDELSGGIGSTESWRRHVLQRRVLWLIGRWLDVRVSCQIRPAIYTALVPLLQRDHDLVVRLTAAETVRDAVDNFEFRPEDLVGLLGTLFRLLFELLVDVVECETKMRVLNVVSLVVERLGADVVPHCDQLLSYLPRLWHQAAELAMLRVMIARTLEHLVSSVGGDTGHMHDLLLQVIGLGVDLSDPAHVYLMDDALHLWRTVVENEQTLHTDFLQLYERLLPVMETGSDSLECGLAITQAYMLLNPDDFLPRYGSAMARVCTDFADGDQRIELTLALLRTVETGVRCSHHSPPALTLMSSLLPWPLHALLNDANSGRLQPGVTALMLSVLARLLLHTPLLFRQLLAAAAQKHQLQSIDAVLSKLLDVWLAAMPNIGQIERKKLCALALCSLLASCVGVIAGRINAITLSVAETLHDVSVPDSLADSLLWHEDADDSEYSSETAHDRRRRALLARDPAHTRALKDAVADSFSRLRSAVGQLRYTELLSEIDVETRAAIETYVSLS